MSVLIPDLKGTSSLYKELNFIVRIQKNQTKICFDTVIYKKSLDLGIVGTSKRIPFLEFSDWTVEQDDVDYQTMGAMQRLEPSFNDTLIRSVTIRKVWAANYDVSGTYQRLYRVDDVYANSSTDQVVNVTPKLFSILLHDVASLKVAVAPVKDAFIGASTNPRLLEPDPHKENPDNYIAEEIWTVDTTSKASIIHPIYGSFFRDSLEIYRFTSDGAKLKLQENVDYRVAGACGDKLKFTTNTSGVYEFVVLIQAFVCDIELNYHAYGGIPTIADVRALAEMSANLYKYILDVQPVTPSSLTSVPAFAEVLTKLQELEESMRKLHTQGTPSYGDATHGGCLLKKISSVDSEFHWWTIAQLYTVAGSSQVFTADTAHFQIQTLYSKFQIDLYIGIHLENDIHPLKVTTASSMSVAHIPFEDDTDLDRLVRPQIRIIYNHNTVQGSGVYIQFGMKLNTAEETLAVADNSGQECCVKLIPSPAEVVDPEDDDIMLPSGNHLWSTLNPDSRQDTHLVPLEEGHVIWAGSLPLNRTNSGWNSFSLTHFLESYTDISRIVAIELLLEEINSERIVVRMPTRSTSTKVTGVASISYAAKPANFVVRIARNPVSKLLETDLSCEIAAGLISNEIDLRYVVIYT